MAFDGMRVLALESRRAAEMAELIRRQGGAPFVAPAVREAPVELDEDTFRFAERLFAGGYEMMMLLTGVGTRQLNRALSEHYTETAFADALREVTIAARGPKPVAALREMGLTPEIVAPEPNTWKELLAVTERRPERSVAVQEYGRSNPDFLEALRARGCDVTPVRIYRYSLPENVAPLREAARRLAAGEFQVVLFTTGVQIVHLMQIAEEQGAGPAVRAALERALVASIGPTTTEALDESGVHPALEPSHPKMGLLVRETAEKAPEILRGRSAS